MFCCPPLLIFADFRCDYGFSCCLVFLQFSSYKIHWTWNNIKFDTIILFSQYDCAIISFWLNDSWITFNVPNDIWLSKPLQHVPISFYLVFLAFFVFIFWKLSMIFVLSLYLSTWYTECDSRVNRQPDIFKRMHSNNLKRQIKYIKKSRRRKKSTKIINSK